MESELRFRQIHLDFHTSRAIEGVGAEFDPDLFADTLQRAHVDSVNLLARGHHGWIYYDTPGFPERRHPHLKRSLLDEQIALLKVARPDPNISLPLAYTLLARG